MISASEINDMMKYCLYRPDELKNNEPPPNAVLVKGIVRNFGFNPERLQSKKERLAQIIDELHSNFTAGGGWTFLNLPFDKDNNQWGEQPDAEALIALCMGNKMAEYCMPRSFWDALPGGVPYVIFMKSDVSKKETN